MLIEFAYTQSGSVTCTNRLGLVFYLEGEPPAQRKLAAWRPEVARGQLRGDAYQLGVRTEK